jgi:stage V sporulation protein D (sporulation-specific penicillin-binding protein)
MVENERRAPAVAAAAAAGPASPLAMLADLFRGDRDSVVRVMGSEGETPKLIRYVSIGGVLEDWRAERVRAAKIPGVHLELRPVREQTAPELTASLVGAVGVDHDGLLGAERMLDALVRPRAGRLRYVRDAQSRPLWVEQGGYVAPERGRDVRLSIDLELQRIAHEELSRAIEECDAAGARLVLMDPMTGEVLALLDLVRQPPDAVEFTWERHDGPRRRYRVVKAADPSELAHPALARNRCVEDVYEPGSTFKAFMWSTATALGLADPQEPVDTEGGRWVTPYGRSIEDVVRRGTQTWAEVLVNSSNIGMVKVTRRMSEKQMHDAVVRFGFGTKTNLGLPGESPGLVTPLKHWTKYTHTSVAMGYEVAVTPVQMVRAFSAFARTGELAGTIVEPRLIAAEPGEETGRGVRRVLPPAVADLTRETMRRVAHNMDERLHRVNKNEPPPRYELFGKSGTAKIPLGRPPQGKRRPRGMRGYFEGQYNTSFIAAGPADKPRLICLVVIDDPGPQLVRENRYYGSHTAGPVVRRVMERALAYLGVPPTYPEGEAPGTGH